MFCPNIVVVTELVFEIRRLARRRRSVISK
jgi:hypothetical protein